MAAPKHSDRAPPERRAEPRDRAPAASHVLPGDLFAAAISGTASALPHRAEMEAGFGQRFADVEAHVATPEARAGLGQLGARAAAFGPHVAFADADPDPRLVAHELAHVVQHGDRARPGAATAVSRPGDAAERRADRAADAVVRGAPVPDVGSADAVTLHLTTVNSNGGVFDNGPLYLPISGTGAVGDVIGADIQADFTANDLVEAPVNGIALIQTVTSQTNLVPGTATLNPTRDQSASIAANDDQRSLIVPAGQPGAGTAIDRVIHRPGRTDSNHNPIYGVGYGGPAPSTSLHDGIPSLGRTARGAHVRNAAGTLDPPVPAMTQDTPQREIEVAGQTFAMQFELAALVTDGPMANTYLGSVAWGWRSDAAGTVTLDPFTSLASGAPTAGFMAAAQAWNPAIFHDPDAFDGILGGMFDDVIDNTVASVDLPITTLPSGVTAAVDLATPDLINRLAIVDAEVAALTAGPSVDRTNKLFEQRALQTELLTRNVELNLKCDRISDTGSAAVPPEDEVWLALDKAATFVITSQRTYRVGDAHLYSFSVADLLPMTGPLHVAIFEHDRAGPGGRAHDDLLVELDWLAPYRPRIVRSTAGDYELSLGFDR